ncbi:MAG: CcdB family protein [Silvibacterium sp.]|nr:CcdB family protein [Silvibacterium sp.]
MAQFDVYRYGVGYVLDVQADLMADLDNRVVIPLLPLDQAPKAANRLNPIFPIDDADHMLLTQYMAAISTSLLREKVCSLKSAHFVIKAAIDMIFDGV